MGHSPAAFSISGWRRLGSLLRVSGRHGVAFFGARLRRRHPWLGTLRREKSRPSLDGPTRLRVLFEELGGTFVKFGQMLALQPDILPVEYCNALFKLLDQVDPFPYAEVDRTLREELGRAPSELFDRIETEPLATASVGQVHVAYLGGRKVAVKVQRPNVESEFSDDIRVMAFVVACIKTLNLKTLEWMIEPMTEFIEWTREELDYRNEARCSESLRRLIGERPGQHIPRVYDELTTRRILVVDFIDGITLLGYMRAVDRGDEMLLRRLHLRGFDRRQVALHVIDNFLANAFEHGLYHADLHPANLMALDGNVVGYIDFGITGVMNVHARRHLMQMTLALAQGDLEMLHEQFLRVTSWGDGSDLEGFRDGLLELGKGWYTPGPQGLHLTANFTRVMTEMLHLSRRTDVMPERNVIKYIRSSIAIDGLVSRFDPELDLSRYLAEQCARYLRWQRRGRFLESERFLDWTAAAAHLFEAGSERGSKALDRLVSGDLPVRLDLQTGPGAARRLLSAQLTVILALAVGLTAMVPEGILGADLEMAIFVFIALTAVCLVLSLGPATRRVA